ncbi:MULTISPECIES: DUF998 domain-containing protein [unclassified Actinomyces]|uniref:DUF998 domain-containing protein n=1 Tax=unclassified Actinomyces TaxID=2609248 RepID=UPI00201825E2|nr:MULTISPECIES: DUF998 domain-containing protein [unclassified Actinomyces]MCL3777018.1 DUF998 domain-containing protein [Actinomyces sp. AC-20-1]MCL3789349.1 DUF998 domain-containing protein [Actinomyces sp. 187325]MCL3791239.1 DUF998 domain-containing protein [Actinomyces sp. 186855]MCL3793742.1 DUF998 domain-containing protein [Actinomyces sp. 217892]
MRRLLAAGVLLSYNTWVLAPLLWGGDVPPGYLSELAADDQPWQWVFRGGDLLAGALLLAIAALGVRGWRARLGDWSAAVSLALAASGVGTVADALGNMPCAPTTDAMCRDTATVSGVVHVIASGTVGAGFLMVLGLLVLGLRDRGAPRAQVRAVLVAAGALGAVDVLTLVVAALAPGSQVWPQVGQVLLSSLLAAALTLGLERGADGGARLPARTC